MSEPLRDTETIRAALDRLERVTQHGDGGAVEARAALDRLDDYVVRLEEELAAVKGSYERLKGSEAARNA